MASVLRFRKLSSAKIVMLFEKPAFILTFATYVTKVFPTKQHRLKSHGKFVSYILGGNLHLLRKLVAQKVLMADLSYSNNHILIKSTLQANLLKF